MSQTVDYVNIKNLDDALVEIDALRNASKKNAKYKKISIFFDILVAIVCISLLSISYELENKKISQSQWSKRLLNISYELENKKTYELKSATRDIETKYINEMKEDKEKIMTLEDKLSKLESENENLAEKANWYDANIAIVPNDGKNLYHKYGCKNLLLGDCTFWAYNYVLAESKGYTKCYVCH